MKPDKALLRLSKARTSLILSHPFVGSVALNMPMRLDDSIPTASTNGSEVRYNPDFLATLTDDQITFLVAHECFHPMLEHMYRMQGRQHMRWNMAADYVINQLLTDENIGRFIPGGCLNKSLYDAGKGTAEGIYDLLPEGDGNAPGGTGADMEQPSGSPAEQAQQQAEWRIKTAQAAQAAKMMGKLSANMERFVTEMLYPKVDWRDVLRQFVVKAATDERSWARPNRRFASQGYYAPGRSGVAMGPLVVAVDCSGSVGSKELNEFAAEVRAIHEDTKPSALHIVYFDSEVCHQDSFAPGDTVAMAPHGGGGTAFSPVIRCIDEQGLEPVACVFLTDLYCNDFGSAPEYPVLWVSNGSKRAPWGEVVAL
jgi:predicted metal-dependent peptidase